MTRLVCAEPISHHVARDGLNGPTHHQVKHPAQSGLTPIKSFQTQQAGSLLHLKLLKAVRAIKDAGVTLVRDFLEHAKGKWVPS